MSTTIAINALAKHYPPRAGQPLTKAVDDVSLTINPGELFFLLGPSGCGKTTLLRMIAGFIDPTKGSIHFDQTDVTHMPANKRDTGMVFQSYALWPHMTVAQNVAFGLDVRKTPAEEKTSAVAAALDAVQMAPYADRKPTQLSGGQQQRVALARALVVRPRVLLLDEPLSNLDAKLRIELRSEIRRICKDAGMTTVYVTHDQKEALSMADRVAIMRDGQTQQIGTPEDLYRRPSNPFVASFLGETNLLTATINTIDNNLATLSTPAGSFAARIPANLQLTPGNSITVSIRPEALRITLNGDASSLKGTLTHTTYLGEVAQHIITAQGLPALHVCELNPREFRSLESRPVALTADPDDIAIVAS